MFNHRERLLWQAAYGGLIVWVALSVFCGSATAYAASPQDSGGFQDRTATDPDTQGSGDETHGPDGSRQDVRSTPRPEASTQSELTDTGEWDAGTALPPDRLVDILRQQPEALVAMKRIAVRYLQEQGRTIADSELTDDVLFARVKQDEQLRRLLTRELKTRGYLSDDDLEYLDRRSSGPSARQPGQFSRRLQAPRPAPDQNQLTTTRRPNPYPGLPALQDLYRQIPSKGTPLNRFGADIFLNGTGNLDNLPMDLPAGSDYVLGPGDGLNINLWGSTSQRLSRVVDREGRVALPDSGSVVIAGQTVSQAQETIRKALGATFRDARVDVSLTRLRTVRVYVVGDVERPGAYDISSLSTALNALYAAGGPTSRGSLRMVRQYRGKQLVREVDLYELMLQGVRSDAGRLEPGDTILVPPVGAQVSVDGMVRRPAIYELKGEAELGDVLQLAGGVLVSAALRQINVERIEAHQRRVMLSVNLPNNADKAALDKALSDFHVQDGDRITISPILPYSEQTVYLQGHVFRPGKYPYHSGIQISDLIRSYQDLLPEPADHAEIVRLVPPDYHPTVIEFKLSEVVSGDDPIDLQPFDTIRIFGRYEIDPPKVSIYGEVLRPGEYPLANGMTAADLVRLAGGFKRSAYTQTADITSHVVSHGDKVLTRHKTVEIGAALSGDHDLDALLKPGDVLTIHQLSGWRDIGASVVLNGEVLFPGTYGIEDGEKLSTLLRQAGGFRPEAYAEGAILERKQVREMEEKTRQELVRRIEIESASTKVSASETGPERTALLQTMAEQKEHVLSALRTQPATGRLVIKISSDIEHWQNTAADIELRAGDVLTIPKRPSFVLISGQVYSPSAITYTPGKNAGWYLRQAGGPTDLANKKDIYVIRANGGVVGQRGESGLWKGNVLSTVMRPGDTLVVPEKIITGSNGWKNVLTTAQFVSSMAIAAAAVHSF
jgi:protein involved in polysaccharide export with SLBB domain